MSLIKELQRLVRADGPIFGQVISASDTNAVVATASGQMEVSSDSNLQAGDLVTVENGRATKKQRGSNIPTYSVGRKKGGKTQPIGSPTSAQVDSASHRNITSIFCFIKFDTFILHL